MRVYKFGGASVKSADGVKNLTDIVADQKGSLFVVVSAMGKSTNALEGVVDAFYNDSRPEALEKLRAVEECHRQIVEELWGKQPEELSARLDELLDPVENLIQRGDIRQRSYEEWYDTIVGTGELLSTTIVSAYLDFAGVTNRWLDMRQLFVTDERFRDANIDIERSTPLLRQAVESAAEQIFVGQGFIGATPDGRPTTIGREGSDYSAAVAGYILDADDVSIWKDVEGVLNADPKIFPDAEYIPALSYLDAIELAYSGAQIIHPKTVKPLQNKSIPLYVKCFKDKRLPGSVICAQKQGRLDVPILIVKHNQVLLTIRPYDLSFVLEERFAAIFAMLEGYGVKINLIQSSAVSLSLCIDSTRHLDQIVERLNEKSYHVVYNDSMELLTVRGYTSALRGKYDVDSEVFLSQRTRRLLRLVRKAK